MEWQFRKILESTQNYRSGSPRFMAGIEKNSPGVLKTIVREIQLIMPDPNANIFSKVLAMRFARDIMILGRQDVINQLTKLVPHMLKVCSYRIESEDPNRGESFFFDHPQYVNATADEKETIQSYGSTYFILNLQSMWHWGNWIKVDESGNESLYSKGLSTLIERGVRFPTHFNYYKNSDTEKFKNTYRVQFFPQQSSDFDSSMRSSSAKSDRNSQQNNRTKQLNTVEEIVNELRNNQAANPRRVEKIEDLKKSAISLLQRRYHPSMVYYGKDKLDKKWLENFIIYSNLLTQRKITYEELIKRVNTQTVEIPEKSEYQPSPQQHLQSKQQFKKVKTSAKRQLLSKPPEQASKTHETCQQSIKKLKTQIKQLAERLEQHKAQATAQKNNIINSYEERIRNIKEEIGHVSNGKNQGIIKENQRLRDRMYQLERSLQVSRSRELEIGNAVAAYQMLKVENQNLKKLGRRPDDMNGPDRNELIMRISELERELNSAKNENQVILTKLPIQNDLKRKDKQIGQLGQELRIFKNSLQSERSDFDRKYKLLQAKYRQLQNQISNLKQKNKNLQKKLDLRDIQAVQLTQQVKLFRALGSQQKYSKSNQKPEYSQRKSQSNEQDIQGTPKGTRPKPLTSYNFKKYENLKNSIFRNQKQRFLRFVRCSLKRKDLLLKENELEIGLISQPFSNNQVKYIIHLTNTSESQINQLRIFCEATHPGDQVALQTQYIFCLQSNEQEKLTLQCRASDNFLSETYDPVILTINYIKDLRSFEVKLALPFMLFKTIELYKIDRRYETNLHNQYSLTLPYSQKLLSDGKYLHSYFPPIESTGPNKYQCDCLWRQTGSRFRLEFQIRQDKKLTIVVSPIGESRANAKQQQIIEQDLLGFLQFCFRKQ